jgi:hypothetical protein
VKSVTVTFTAAQVAGDLNVLVASWSDVVNTVVSVTDSAGNVYTRALAPTIVADTSTQVMYYAKAILAASAGSNQVTITWSGSAAFPDVRIAEYTGVDQTNPLDTASGKWGTGPLAESGPLVTTGAPDLIVAGSYSAGLAIGPGVGYTQRLLTTPDGDILEDTVGYAANSYTATVPMATTAWWIVQAAAFRLSAAPVTDSTPPVVTINSPAAGDTVSGVMTADISATDAGAVQAVQLLVDGLPMGFAEIYAPYDLFVNTALFANGPHVLTAYAWDEFENVGTSASVTVTFYNPSPGNPAQDGMWTGTVPSPIVSTASALLPGGRVLFWDGQSQGWDARVWDPRFNMFFIDTPAPSNIFCVGLEQTADGRVLVVGGHVTGHTGITAANVFDPDTLAWTPLAQMVYPRWYPTLTELPDGRFIVQSGETNCDGCDVATPEIFDLAANTWTELSGSQFKFNFYPHSFVLPDGRLLVSSNIETPMVSQVLDLGTGAWTAIGGPAVDGGSAVMYLPGKVLKTGTTFDPGDTGTASSASAYVLDATQPSPTWQQVASMNMPLSYHTMTMLPDGTVLLTGGGLTTAATDTANAVLHPQIWSPTTQTFTTLGSTMNAPRLYHSSALLMPDGRVLAAGGGRADDVTASTDQFSNEFFAPPYLFKGPRPVITSAPTTVPYGQQFVVQTPDAARIGQVSLIRYGATTHTVDMGQRFVPLTFAVGTGSLTVTAPPNGNWAPPGNYMLFIVDTTGVPSVAATVRL